MSHFVLRKIAVRATDRPAFCLWLLFLGLLGSAPLALFARELRAPRARELGIPFEGVPGPLNAITDVPEVTVGEVTLIEGEGKLVVGRGPIRSGVTVIFPRGQSHADDPVPSATSILNGNGEMTGVTWLEESGFLEGPIAFTNTHSVGVVHDAVIAWGLAHYPGSEHFSLPVVAETWDGFLNDINGFDVTREHVWQALENAQGGPVVEGNSGGGTGTRLFEFKGGTGTASRRLAEEDGGYFVGVLVQANFGRRSQLLVAGVPVGQEITDLRPVYHRDPDKDGSVLVALATNAPLLPHQIKRLARRIVLGVARVGGVGNDSSGDLFIAWSTAAPRLENGLQQWQSLPNNRIDPLFSATEQATEEAIINALVAAQTMSGINGNTIYAIPHDRLRAVLRKYGRLQE